MKGIIGFYNAEKYSVCSIDENGQIEEELYTAGNSPLDSQVSVNAFEGVGLETMREFCETSSKIIAKDNGYKYLGVQEDEE